MSQQQTEQLMQQMQMLENYITDLSQRENSFVNVLRETAACIETLKALSQNPESETLAPIGMGIYMPTKFSSDSKAIVHVGAGVAVEKDISSATNYLEAKIKEIQVALQDTAAKKHDGLAQFEQIKSQINQIMQLQTSEPSG